MADDQQTIKSQSQDVVLEEASKYEYVVTLEKTEKVRDMYSADATSQGGDRQPTSYIDRTVTWTIGSNSPIDHGVFLDNSPWVVDNGDIHLLATTPEEENNMYGEIVFNGEVGDFDAGWDFNLDNPVTKNYRINSTVINPYFGFTIVDQISKNPKMWDLIIGLSKDGKEMQRWSLFLKLGILFSFTDRSIYH